ncbi:unnamed protein product [Diatraea saccharalis]|uniref:G-protein coupled receptors family 2 profile 2 domain-containing protein n=1 Tax=Diatraea saccharalis TaxID=40085 RepID=A0A9N9QWR3_9NEOP|nr:unnamed protein product [Diatraea saccharalis]
MSIINNQYCSDPGAVIFGKNENSTVSVSTLIGSSVGLLISIIAFIMLIMTAVLFKEWRESRKNQLLIQFMIARIFYITVRYIIDFRNHFYAHEARCVLYLDFICLVYTEYALICWMFIFSMKLNDSLVKVFNTSESPLWKVSLGTWLIPAFVTALLWISFTMQTDRELLFFLLYLLLLKWPVLCANAIFLITALNAVIRSNISKSENNVKIVLVMLILIFGFSLQQTLIDIYKIVHLLIIDYYVTFYLNIINIIMIYHCAFSILFWLFGNAKTRKLWRREKPKLPTSSELNFRMSIQ